MMHDDDPKVEYRWEKNINATWDAVQEDEHGNIISLSKDRERSQKAKQNRITQSIRRGLIRYLVIAIDCSDSAGDKDYRPSRIQVSKDCVQKFIIDYFDQNPISQLCLALTRDRLAEKLTDLSGNPKNHIHKLQAVNHVQGLASLQNTILLSMNMLKYIPNYGHKEVLIVYSSLSTCDPGDIYETIREAKRQRMRINIISLVAELFICKQICEMTGGIFAVAMDSTHLSELLTVLTIPPPEVQSKETPLTNFIYMGFPTKVFDEYASYGFDGQKTALSAEAYVCPRCHTRATDIPTQCSVCSLQLNSSAHIARSYLHLFPVANFKEYTVVYDPEEDVYSAEAVSPPEGLESDAAAVVSSSRDRSNSAAMEVEDASSHSTTNGSFNTSSSATVGASSSVMESSNGGGGGGGVDASLVVSCCAGCQTSLCEADKMVMRCTLCHSFFCVECDIFIHDSLHNCPGCD